MGEAGKADHGATGAGDDLAGRLAAALDRHIGPGHRVESLHRLSGGASRQTWRFSAIDGRGTARPMILKRDPIETGGPPFGVDVALGVDRATECAAFRAALAAGVPAPETILLAGPEDGLGAAFVMAAIEGETIARKILRDSAFADARPKLAAQCGDAAARIHAIDPNAIPGLKRLDAAAELAVYRRLLDDFGQPQPGFEYGIDWLARRAPADRPLTVVHGDFRNGNFIVGPEGLRAVLDWELTHLGDPLSDLGWLCIRSWRYGAPGPVGGFGERAELFRAYEAAGGEPVDPALAHYWEVFGTLRWGILCMMMGFSHIRGAHRSIEMAAIGRRAAETEYDLLDMID